MTTPRKHHLETARTIRAELFELLEGMDYCLDWKPEPITWCVREVVYHLLDTPPDGIHSVAQGVLSGELAEYELCAYESNITPERQAKDMAALRGDIDVLFQRWEQASAEATEHDLSGETVMTHLNRLKIDEQQNEDVLLERGFAGHWREHLKEIGKLRALLGFS